MSEQEPETASEPETEAAYPFQDPRFIPLIEPMLDDYGEDELTDAEMAWRDRPQPPPPPETLAERVARQLDTPDHPDPTTCDARPEHLGDLVRAVRWCATLSQRELAERARVPRSVVSRLENDRDAADPRLSTVLRIVESAGLRLVVADDEGTLLSLPPDQTRYRDEGDRRFPAHLHNRSPATGWYGWGLIGSPDPRHPDPERIHRRSRRRRRPDDTPPVRRPGSAG